MLKFEIKAIEFCDLDGNNLPIDTIGLGKSLGNYIYTTMHDLAWLEKAQAMHKGERLEMSEQELDEFGQTISSNNCMLILPVKQAILNHIKKLKNGNETSE